MFFITLLDQIYWVASAAMGAALGSVLPFSTEGVDFVMTAMFVVIFLNQWEKEKQHASAIIGIAAPLVCLRIFGSDSSSSPRWSASLCTAAVPPPHRGQRKRGGKMSNIQFILTIAVCAAATMLTRFLPFLVFGSRGGKVPEVVEYLGHVLPAAIFGMLIVYCLKGVSLTSGSHGIPEAIAIGVTVASISGSIRRWFPSPAARCAMCCWCKWCFKHEKGHGIAVSFSCSVIERIKIDLPVESLLQLVEAVAVLRQQPHDLRHDGLNGHVVGLEEAEAVLDPLAHLIDAHVAALVSDLGGEDEHFVVLS